MRQAPIRIASSATNTASIAWSSATSTEPADAMIAGDVSRPSVMAFITISTMMVRWNRGSSAMAASLPRKFLVECSVMIRVRL